MPLNIKTAEKLFNKKASPAASMPPKAFMKQEMKKMGMGMKNYAKNVAGGARIVGSGIKNAFKNKKK